MKLIKSMLSVLLIVAILLGVLWGIYTLYPLKYIDEIRESADEMGVDRYLVAALIKAESNYNPAAVSSAGAMGVMQLTEETALFCSEKLGVTLSEGDIFTPEVNIRLGTYYLKRTMELFNNDESLAVAAYNAGEGRVRGWLNDERYSSDGETLHTIPYEETKNHVEKIENYKKIYKMLYPNL